MENKEFYDTLIECIDYICDSTGMPESKNIFTSVTKQYGYPNECLDAYDEKYDYKKVFLSYYYYQAWYNNEDDFDGKPLASADSNDMFYGVVDIMKKRPVVAKYIDRSVSLNRLVELKERYGLL